MTTGGELKADLLEELTETVDAICSARDPEDDSEVVSYRDRFTDEEWAAIMDAARASLLSSVRGAVLARYMTEIATSLGLVTDRDVLQADLFETVRSQRDGTGNAGEAALRRRPGGGPLLHALGAVELLAVVAASGEIENLLSN